MCRWPVLEPDVAVMCESDQASAFPLACPTFTVRRGTWNAFACPMLSAQCRVAQLRRRTGGRGRVRHSGPGRQGPRALLRALGRSPNLSMISFAPAGEPAVFSALLGDGGTNASLLWYCLFCRHGATAVVFCCCALGSGGLELTVGIGSGWEGCSA